MPPYHYDQDISVRLIEMCRFLQVTMADRASADRACKDPNPIIDGRKANVNLAYLGAKPRVIQPGEGLDYSFVSQLQDNQGGIQRQYFLL